MGRCKPVGALRAPICSRHLVLVKTQLGTVYTHQEFKYEVIDIHSLLLQRPSHPRVIQ